MRFHFSGLLTTLSNSIPSSPTPLLILCIYQSKTIFGNRSQIMPFSAQTKIESQKWPIRSFVVFISNLTPLSSFCLTLYFLSPDYSVPAMLVSLLLLEHINLRVFPLAILFRYSQRSFPFSFRFDSHYLLTNSPFSYHILNFFNITHLSSFIFHNSIYYHL